MPLEKKLVIVIDCDFGNIASVTNALKYLKVNFKVLKKPNNIKNASHLILPGVGSFGIASKKIKSSGWFDTIHEFVETKKPLMGICLGMQLLFERGTEDGNENGLGFFEGVCEKFKKKGLSLPHIGFNTVTYYKNSKIWNNIENHSPFYFIHDYRLLANCISEPTECKISKTFYGEEFISFIEKNNIYGAQFHPEKSHITGLVMLKNFIEISN